ncbi:MAG TPA: hypothetical protein PKA55_17550 [Rhodoblastus sp.]|nr:hypothetical protein [Rhodoblastus sp.]
MSKALLAVSAALAMGAAVFVAPASAAPMADRGVVAAIQQDHAQVEKARIVCDRFGRCWRRPNYWGPRFVGPGYVAPIYRPYRPGPRLVCNAWGRCWRRW